MPLPASNNTKAGRRENAEFEMHKFKAHRLHSGSPHGPKVTDRKQAIAIMLSETGQAKPQS